MTLSDTGIGRPLVPASFQLVEDICRRAFGFRLLTVLSHRPGAAEIERIHTSNPQDYPTGGRKLMGPTPWGEIVLQGGQGWWGEGATAIRWAFPDAEKILALGCESLLCAPVLDQGRTIGVLSLNHAAGSYRPEDLDLLGVIAQSLRKLLLGA